MERDQLPPHRTATYVLPRWKIVYVAVNKAACTSLKWLVAGLQGEDPQHFYATVSREISRTMTIHRRSRWQRTPMLHELPPAKLARISPENGWFVFAVVRHPTNRFFSAWQSKLLLREPGWVLRFESEPWFPRVPASSDELVEDFHRFVRFAATRPRPRVIGNRHFRPQVEIVRPDRMPYTRIYDVREMPVLLEELRAHLGAQGWDSRLGLPASNETPLRPLASMFTSEVVAAMEQIYERDLALFDYASAEPQNPDQAAAYSTEALGEISRLVDRSERIADLVAVAYNLKAARRDHRARLANQGRHLSTARRSLRELARSARRSRRLTRLKRRLPPRLRRAARRLARG
jgi:hypothetical protein